MAKRNHIQDISSLDNATAYILQRTARLLRFYLSKFMAEFGISPEQWFILFRLYERPGRSQTELADPSLNDHPNITRLVDGLQKNGLVVRTRDPNDRRRHLLHLTTAGEALVNEILPHVVEERASIFAGISQTEVDDFLSVLKRIEGNLK